MKFEPKFVHPDFKPKLDTIGKLVLIFFGIGVLIFFIVYREKLYELAPDRTEFSFNFGDCSDPTVRTYQGPNLPSDRIATIETTKTGDGLAPIITNVQKVDGEEIKPERRWWYLGKGHACKIEVLPGEHQLVCYVEWGMVIQNTMSLIMIIRKGPPHTLAFKAEAGHVYKVYGGRTYTGAAPMWIVDEQNGAFEAGNK